jgi:hypothetical protein
MRSGCRKRAKGYPASHGWDEIPFPAVTDEHAYALEISGTSMERGWTENDGAVVEPDRAVIAFTTTDGPALLRLIHEDERTIADLSLRKPPFTAC